MEEVQVGGARDRDFAHDHGVLLVVCFLGEVLVVHPSLISPLAVFGIFQSQMFQGCGVRVVKK